MKLLFTNSDNIKLALMMQYRFAQGAYLVSTECGNYSSDFLAVNKYNQIVEVEVKVSLTDFKADFKKPKHKIYEHTSKLTEWDKKSIFVPNYFYFAVPESILNSVLPLLIGRPYGVIAVPDIEFRPHVNWIAESKYLRVVKKATMIRKHEITESEKRTIISRVSSELINSKINNLRKDHGKEKIGKSTEVVS